MAAVLEDFESDILEVCSRASLRPRDHVLDDMGRMVSQAAPYSALESVIDSVKAAVLHIAEHMGPDYESNTSAGGARCQDGGLVAGRVLVLRSEHANVAAGNSCTESSFRCERTQGPNLLMS
jgi:hypothetical protein